MSQENVDLVMRLQPASDVDLAQLVRNDETAVAFAETVAPVFHADFESARPGLLGSATTYTGLDGLGALWLDWLAPRMTYRLQIEDAVDLGDRVLVRGRAFGRLEGSQAEVENTFAGVWTVRDGKVARVEMYADRVEALKAVGLEE